MDENEEIVLTRRLENLRNKHQLLDDTIDQLNLDDYSDELQLRRLKKEKLAIREQIVRLEEVIYPDIIA